MRVVTKDSPSANNIQARFGTTNARGQNKPKRMSSEPSGRVMCAAVLSFPR